MKISGYVIVETPEDYLYPGLGRPLYVEGLAYKGVGRLWWDFDPRELPDRMRPVVQRAEENRSKTLMYNLFSKREDADEALSCFSDSADKELELLGMYSSYLESVIGAFDTEDGAFLGIDVDAEDCGFLIKEELFARQIQGTMNPAFKNDFDRLNSHGIFSHMEEAQEFVEAYFEAQKEWGFGNNFRCFTGASVIDICPKVAKSHEHSQQTRATYSS